MGETDHSNDLVASTGWDDFEGRLATYLATMVDNDDHLIIEVPDDDGEDGTAPYAQFCVAGEGAWRGEVSGNRVLAPRHRLSADQLAELAAEGIWAMPEAEDGCPNFAVEVGEEGLQDLAYLVCELLRDRFGIPHPTLMTAHGWGPAADDLDALGLTLRDELPASPAVGVVVRPGGVDDLREPVRQVLADFLGEDPEVDDDGDFLVSHDGVNACVVIRGDAPCVEVFRPVVRDVRSRRQAAVEANLLNRDQLWTRYVVIDRSVFQFMRVPAMPFLPEQLRVLLPEFFLAYDAVRSDLETRTGGRA